MNKPKPNFNTEDVFYLFKSYSEFAIYALILRVSDYEDKFIHDRKSRTTLAQLTGFSEIHVMELLRALTTNGVFRKGKRGVYNYNPKLIR